MLSRVRRLATELLARDRPSAGDDAVAALRVVRDGDMLVVSGAAGRTTAGRALADLGDDEAPAVHLAPGVYASVPHADARVRLLRLLRNASAGPVTLHVVVRDETSHLSRALVDAPRRLLRRARLPLAEPGDRHDARGGFVHCFFDDETLLDEIARAGLRVVARDGSTFVLGPEDGAGASETGDDAFPVELARVAPLLPVVDRARARLDPAAVLAVMRERGLRTARTRSAVGRARLRRAIGWVDAVAPGGASCYRRILLESALDAGAAAETVVFGLDVGRTGHVAFEGKEDLAFDVAFAIPAPPRDAP